MSASSENPIDVWLVEDNAMFRMGVERILNRLEGMSCGGNFRSAEAAFEALASSPAPDVILLDVQLPGMDGIEALGGFRKLAPDAQVIILSVFDDADKIFRAVCAGASGYVLKSSGIDQIGSAIEQVVAGGAPMTPRVARKVLKAFAKMAPHREGIVDYELTARELEILRLLAEGLVKKDIADRLDLSGHTVSAHLRKVYTKLHVGTNTGAVAEALRERII